MKKLKTSLDILDHSIRTGKRYQVEIVNQNRAEGYFGLTLRTTGGPRGITINTSIQNWLYDTWETDSCGDHAVTRTEVVS